MKTSTAILLLATAATAGYMIHRRYKKAVADLKKTPQSPALIGFEKKDTPDAA